MPVARSRGTRLLGEGWCTLVSSAGRNVRTLLVRLGVCFCAEKFTPPSRPVQAGVVDHFGFSRNLCSDLLVCVCSGVVLSPLLCLLAPRSSACSRLNYLVTTWSVRFHTCMSSLTAHGAHGSACPRHGPVRSWGTRVSWGSWCHRLYCADGASSPDSLRSDAAEVRQG